MWKEKILFATKRLPRDFGRTVERFAKLSESQEQSESADSTWSAGITIAETSPQSEWVITLSGVTHRYDVFYAFLTDKSPHRFLAHRVDIFAYLQVDDTIRLVTEGTEEDWDKLAGLWDKLWAELARQGYIEAPAVSDRAPDIPQVPQAPSRPWEAVPDVGWNRRAVELWHAGYTAAEIAQRVGRDLTPKTISNVLSNLRGIYGTEVVPERRSNPRPGRKSSRNRE